MSKKLEIRFSWEHRANNHDIPRYTLYYNNKPVYSAQYESCVINYINANYAKKSSAQLKRKLDRLSERCYKLQNQISEVQRKLSKPLVKMVIGNS